MPVSNHVHIVENLICHVVDHVLICAIFFFFFADASSTNEAVHLQQRLKSLSTELVTLRNRLHVDNSNVDVTLPGDATTGAAVNLVTSPNNAVAANLTNGPFVTNHTSMQIGSTAIPIANKSSPKVMKSNWKRRNSDHNVVCARLGEGSLSSLFSPYTRTLINYTEIHYTRIILISI